MQKFAHLLALIIALALAAGPFASALAGPLPMKPAMMASDMHSAMAGMNSSADDCAPCKGSAGAMEECLPVCTSMPAVAPENTVRLSLIPATYEPRLEPSFGGAQSRPDPYPPRPIVLS
jgi:hypothetical protein